MDSGYISLSDDYILDYTITKGRLLKKHHHWDFKKLGWWSRIYEYKFLIDSINYLNQKKTNLKVLDVATGPFHPGSFILENSGKNQVDASDIIKEPKLLKKFSNYNIKFIDDNMSHTKLKNQYDCVACISTLEHVKKEEQTSFLQNMINLTKPGGSIILTFDDPGFEELTDINLYKKILIDNNCSFDLKEAKDDILTNFNGPIVRDFYKEGFVDKELEIKVFKMFITKGL